jgi:hypothetical protein
MNTVWVVGGVAMVVLFGVFYLVMSVANGFGEATEAWAEYGESPRGRPIQQPFCFWSDLGFVLVGLSILLWIDMTPRGNVMATASAYSVIFGLLSVWLGPGSMLEHGTLSRPWGWFDASSIHWWCLFTLAFLIAGWVVPPAQLLEPLVVGLVIALSLAAMVGIGFLTGFVAESRLWVSIILMGLLGGALVLDCTPVFHDPPTRPGWWFLLAAVVTLVLGTIAMLVGRRNQNSNRDIVAGREIFQWHGVWHVCTAVTVLFVFAYLRS